MSWGGASAGSSIASRAGSSDTGVRLEAIRARWPVAGNRAFGSNSGEREKNSTPKTTDSAPKTKDSSKPTTGSSKPTVNSSVSASISTPRKMSPKIKKDPHSPDSVLVGPGDAGGGGGVGGPGGDGGGSPGGGGGSGDPTFDSEGRSEAVLNKTLAAADQSTHRYWRIVNNIRLTSNGNNLEEAGSFISKLRGMGFLGAIGITDKIDVANAEDPGLSAKKHQLTAQKVDNCASVLDKLIRTDSYKTGIARLAQRIADTGQTVLPLVLLKGFLKKISDSTLMNAIGCNLVAVVHDLDSYLAKYDVSFIVLEGSVVKRRCFTVVDGIDMSSILTPLPVGLGERKLVEGVNDTGPNTAMTLSILSQADHEFVTLEMERRAGQHFGATAIKPLSV